jgi:MSHA pilin protein MshA
MKRSAFTLIELIFTIVIIGVLAGLAIPKYKSLEDNAKIATASKFYSDILGSVTASYKNESNLNDVNASDLNLTQLFDFKGKGWTISNSNDTATYDVKTSDGNISLVAGYLNNGTMDLNLTANGAGTTSKLASKTGLTLTSGGVHQDTITLSD